MLEVALGYAFDAVLAVGVILVARRLSEPARAVRRSKAQWLELELEVSGVLEKLGTWAAREAKRQSRAAQRDLSDRPIEPAAAVADQLELPSSGSSSHRKIDLWRRARERAAGNIPNPHRSETRLHSPEQSGSVGGNGSADQ